MHERYRRGWNVRLLVVLCALLLVPAATATAFTVDLDEVIREAEGGFVGLDIRSIISGDLLVDSDGDGSRDDANDEAENIDAVLYMVDGHSVYGRVVASEGCVGHLVTYSTEVVSFSEDNTDKDCDTSSIKDAIGILTDMGIPIIIQITGGSWRFYNTQNTLCTCTGTGSNRTCPTQPQYYDEVNRLHVNWFNNLTDNNVTRKMNVKIIITGPEDYGGPTDDGFYCVGTSQTTDNQILRANLKLNQTNASWVDLAAAYPHLEFAGSAGSYGSGSTPAEIFTNHFYGTYANNTAAWNGINLTYAAIDEYSGFTTSDLRGLTGRVNTAIGNLCLAGWCWKTIFSEIGPFSTPLNNGSREKGPTAVPYHVNVSASYVWASQNDSVHALLHYTAFETDSYDSPHLTEYNFGAPFNCFSGIDDETIECYWVMANWSRTCGGPSDFVRVSPQPTNTHATACVHDNGSLGLIFAVVNSSDGVVFSGLDGYDTLTNINTGATQSVVGGVADFGSESFGVQYWVASASGEDDCGSYVPNPGSGYVVRGSSYYYAGNLSCLYDSSPSIPSYACTLTPDLTPLQDASGSGFTLTNNNDAPYNATQRAYDFDGSTSSSYLSMASAFGTDVDISRSYTFWFKLDSDGFNDPNSQPLVVWRYLYSHARTSNQIYCRFDNTGARSSTHTLGNGDFDWHHAACVYTIINASHASTTLYVDNVLRDSDNHAIHAGVTYSSYLQIGGKGGTYLNGSIGDVRMFDNKALNATEIDDIYNNRTVTDGLVAWYPFQNTTACVSLQ